jgi:hypothetical protein
MGQPRRTTAALRRRFAQKGMARMFHIQRFDPLIEMGPDVWSDLNNVTSTFDDITAGDIEHAQTMAYDPSGEEVGDVPARVSVNVDNIADPSVWFIHWHMLDGSPDTTDIIFKIRDDASDELGPDGEPISDISDIGGAQCGDCGCVNVDHPYNRLHNLIKPVWRIHPDTPNLLCDDCADKRNR